MLSDEARKQYRMVQLISVALITGVALFAVIAAFLTHQGTAPAGSFGTVPLPVIAAVVVVAIFAAPRIGGAIRWRSASDEEGALSNFTLSVIVAQAIREGAGLMGIALALLAGDLTWMIVFTALSVGAMVLGMPGEREVEDVVRPFRSVE